jgi:U3 small nucleolar RNA-associated protein 20
VTIKPKRPSKIQVTVNETLLPALLKHLEQRDEVEDNIRIPVAVGVAKVALHLPEPGRSLQIGRLLTVLSQVFRSKSQDTRDLARETLCRIAASLGQDYLSSVFRQLREALTRGPHLHVLAFVVHAILVHVTSPEHVNNFNRLDDCVPDAAHVSAEVVFGQSGKDVESEGFKTKMKEVRGSSSRGLDSFAIISKHISPTSTANLLRPIKAIMQETESLKSMQLVDEVLRRISSGINSNVHFEPAELLVFCHTLISQNARFFHQKEKGKPRTSKKRSVDNIVVQVKRQQVVEDDHYSHNAWR